MKNPNTWTQAAEVIDREVIKHYDDMSAGIIGGSLAKRIEIALMDEGLLVLSMLDAAGTIDWDAVKPVLEKLLPGKVAAFNVKRRVIVISGINAGADNDDVDSEYVRLHRSSMDEHVFKQPIVTAAGMAIASMLCDHAGGDTRVFLLTPQGPYYELISGTGLFRADVERMIWAIAKGEQEQETGDIVMNERETAAIAAMKTYAHHFMLDWRGEDNARQYRGDLGGTPLTGVAYGGGMVHEPPMLYAVNEDVMDDGGEPPYIFITYADESPRGMCTDVVAIETLQQAVSDDIPIHDPCGTRWEERRKDVPVKG